MALGCVCGCGYAVSVFRVGLIGGGVELSFTRFRDHVPSLTASVTRFGSSTQPADQLAAPKTSDWVKKAWHLYRECPEVRFGIEFISKPMSWARLRIVEEVPSPFGPADRDVHDERVQQLSDVLLGSLRNEKQTQGRLLVKAAQNLAVSGSAWFVSKELEDGSEGFEVFSDDEVSERDGRPLLGSGMKAEPIDLDSRTVLKAISEDPNEAGRPSSNLEALIGVGGLLLMLDKSLRTTLRGNLHADMLMVPREVSFDFAERREANEGLAESPSDVLADQIFDYISQPIENEQAAEALVPMILRAPAEFIDKFKKVSLDRKFDDSLPVLYELLLKRLATGFDLPAEILVGGPSENHWAKWQTSAEFHTSHVQPLLQSICDAFTLGLLHPLLADNGIDNHRRFKVGYDPVRMVVNPNLTASAMDLYKLGELSGSALRYYTGFKPDDAPDEHPLDPPTPRVSQGVQPDRGPGISVAPSNGQVPIDPSVWGPR